MPDEKLIADRLLTALNQTALPFVRDSWFDANNTLADRDYGVLTLTAPPRAVWGDGQMVARAVTGEVWLYTAGDGDAKAAQVEAVLAAQELSWRRLRGPEFLPDIGKTCWAWGFQAVV
jgi:hypothetical protein